MAKKSPVQKNLWRYLKRHHFRNLRKGTYGYMWWAGLKIIIIYILVIVPLLLIAKKFINFNPFFQYIFDNLSDGFVLLLFLVSESFLGMIPPDLFIIWTSKFSSPLLFLTILGMLSYLGGVFSYFIGYWFSTRPRIKAYTEQALDKYIIMVRKWGGAFIIIAALFPFSPYSMVVMAVSLLKYPFRYFLLFGIARIARFLIQGVFYLNIMNLDTLFAFM